MVLRNRFPGAVYLWPCHFCQGRKDMHHLQTSLFYRNKQDAIDCRQRHFLFRDLTALQSEVTGRLRRWSRGLRTYVPVLLSKFQPPGLDGRVVRWPQITATGSKRTSVFKLIFKDWVFVASIVARGCLLRVWAFLLHSSFALIMRLNFIKQEAFSLANLHLLASLVQNSISDYRTIPITISPLPPLPSFAHVFCQPQNLLALR
jgi:hypothetical protein